MKNGSASAPMLNAIVILPDDAEAWLALAVALVPVLVLAELRGAAAASQDGNRRACQQGSAARSC